MVYSEKIIKVLIEVNDGYSRGCYSMEATLHAEPFSASWAELNGTEDESLENTSNKTLKQDEDENILLVVAYSDGAEIAKAAKEGDSDSKETWQNLM